MRRIPASPDEGMSEELMTEGVLKRGDIVILKHKKNRSFSMTRVGDIPETSFIDSVLKALRLCGRLKS
jgi:hypothetical protein